MTFARILAPLTGGQRDATVLASAFAAAKPFNAHVVALFVSPDPVEAMPYYGEGMSSAVVQEIMDVAKDAAGRASQVARACLDQVAAAAGVTVTLAPELRSNVTASFLETQGNFADRVALTGRLSDLIVFGALKESDRPGIAEAFETTLIDTGRPVLLASQAPKSDFAQRIAIAWNGSVASAHAVTAALPFLERASSIEILAAKRTSGEEIPTADLISYLRLRGIQAVGRQVEAGTRPVADVLLEAAGQCGAGMLVAGGYGHNRLREMFVTGVTRRVVAHAAIPCFLVH